MNKYKRTNTTPKATHGVRFSKCDKGLPWADISNQRLQNTPTIRYSKDLSKISSGQASRYPLAFFVPDSCLASQAKQTINTAPIYLSQGNTVYDGVTSQNTKALGRICGAVSTDAESEPRHLIPIGFIPMDNVALTHKPVGGSYHG